MKPGDKQVWACIDGANVVLCPEHARARLKLSAPESFVDLGPQEN